MLYCLDEGKSFATNVILNHSMQSRSSEVCNVDIMLFQRGTHQEVQMLMIMMKLCSHWISSNSQRNCLSTMSNNNNNNKNKLNIFMVVVMVVCGGGEGGEENCNMNKL